MKKFLIFIRKVLKAETSAKKWSVFTVSVSLGIVLGAALLVFIVDPLYRYRKPFFYDMVYYELYATAPHILKTQQYDLLMLGTSMTRNFFIEDIDSAFNAQSVKLAASGGTIPDLCKFFEIAKASRTASPVLNPPLRAESRTEAQCIPRGRRGMSRRSDRCTTGQPRRRDGRCRP